MELRFNISRRLARAFLACTLCFSGVPALAFAADVPQSAQAPRVSSEGSECAGISLDGLVAGEDYVADELLVSFSSSVSMAEAASLADDAGAVVSDTVDGAAGSAQLSSDELPAGTSVLVKVDDGSSLQDAAAAIAQNDSVVSVQPNYLYELTDIHESDEPGAASSELSAIAASASSADPLAASLAQIDEYLPNDPAFATEAHSYQFSMIGAYSAWMSARANRMATVAVVDSGINVDHEDLAGSIVTEAAYNSCTETAGIAACEDTVGHGSHVAGSIAATVNNGLGTAGISFGARIIPIKCTYSYGSGRSSSKASTASVIRGIRYALTQDVQVINLSLGATNEDRLFQQAIDDAVAADISVVCAAGNAGTDAAYYPSDCDGTVSVTAVDSSGQRASYSSYNEHKTIAAPGSDIYGLSCSGASSYKTLSGTSMAAPIVSGAIALLRVANPHLSAKEVEQIIYDTAEDAGDAGWDPYYGWGILRLDKAVSKATEDPVRGFADMAAGQWYTDSDDFGWAVSMGLVSGYSGSDDFGPYDDISRGQLTTMLWRMAGQPQASSAVEFDDVDYTSYYGEAIAWAREGGVVNGSSDGNTFRPDDSITREELCCMFANFAREVAGLKTDSDCVKLDALSDSADVDTWARASVAWCMDSGLVSGVQDDAGQRLAAPISHAWRASAACMITSLMRDVLDSRAF